MGAALRSARGLRLTRRSASCRIVPPHPPALSGKDLRMSNERAFLWIVVVALIGLGLLFGQAAAVAVAAAVATYLVYDQSRMTT